jgi:hypothetical protein
MLEKNHVTAAFRRRGGIRVMNQGRSGASDRRVIAE